MNEDFELQSLRYLFDQMSPEERRRFDGLLTDDRAACALFRSYADALASHMARQAAGAPSLTQEEAELILGRLRFESLPSITRKPQHGVSWKLWVWPTAAALLLALNLWQFLRTPETSPALAPSSSVSREAQITSRPLQDSTNPPPLPQVTAPVIPVRHGLVLSETKPTTKLRLEPSPTADRRLLLGDMKLLPRTENSEPVSATAVTLKTTPTFKPNEALLLWVKKHSASQSPEIKFPPMTTTKGKLDDLLYRTPNLNPPQFLFIKGGTSTPSASEDSPRPPR